eukprot:EG_transcript_10318
MRVTQSGATVSEGLSAADLFWWRVDSPTNPMVVNILFGAEDVLTLAEVRDALRGPVADSLRFHAVPTPHPVGRWRPYLALGLCLGLAGGGLLGWWAAAVTVGGLLGVVLEVACGTPWRWQPVADFSVEDYLRLHTLEEATEEGLHRFVDDSLSQPLDRSRALWQAILIHNVPGGGSGLLFRVHHVIGDGAGLRSWFDAVCLPAKECDANAVNNETPKPRPARVPGRSLREAMAGWLLCLLLAAHSVWKLLTVPRDSNSPLKGPLTGRKVTARPSPALSVLVSDLQAVGKSHHCSVTLNDTLVAWLAGAFRRFFLAGGLHPDQMLLRVMMPVNLRRPSATPAVENRFGLVLKSLPVHLPAARQRLATVRARMQLVKLGIEAPLGMLLMAGLALLPERVMRAVVGHFVRCTTAVLTNVVGPAVPYRLAGHALQRCTFWVPSAGDMGVGISLYSYCGTMGIGLMVDTGLLSDPQPLVEALREEWREMAALRCGAAEDGGDAPPGLPSEHLWA